MNIKKELESLPFEKGGMQFSAVDVDSKRFEPS
jgi:hypothetical protein